MRLFAIGDAVVALLPLPIVALLRLLENTSAKDEEEELREVAVAAVVVVPRCVIVTAAVALA